jgi:DnaK suppressor protein
MTTGKTTPETVSSVTKVSTAKRAAAPAKRAAAPASKTTAPAKKPAAPAKKPAAPASKTTAPTKTVKDHVTNPPEGVKRAASRPSGNAPEAPVLPRRTTVRKALGAPTGPLPPLKRPAGGPYAKEQKFLDEQRELLLEERSVYQGQAEDLRAEADSLAQEREPGDVQFDEESGEGGTVAVDRERDLALSAQAQAAVEEIDDALQRIDRKTYGACERCQEPIPKARLRALPYARLCVACKSGGLSRR